jgi:hypothetical protein
MSEVSKVNLQISYRMIGGGLAQVKVKSLLNFDEKDLRKDFKLKTELFPKDMPGEKSPHRHPLPLYVFLYGSRRKNYELIHPTEKTITHEETREINTETLDEDPGYIWQPLPRPEGSPQPYMQTPNSDEIYAVVSLIENGKTISHANSNVFEMKYVGRIVWAHG